MKWGVAIGIGAVGLIGGIGAAVALSMMSGPATSTPDDFEVVEMAPPSERPDAPPSRRGDADEDGELPIDLSKLQAPVDGPDPREAPEGTFVRPDLGPAFETPVNSLADLEGRFEAGLASSVSLEGLDGLADDEVRRRYDQRVLQATATVSAAADAHLTYADSAPRTEATQARSKAADLYEHLAGVLEDAPVPGHLPEGQAELQTQVLSRMAERHRRKASALRASK